ncbi:hypothetical protein ACHAWC_000432 [Mediolabrus comicus]
MCSKVDCRNCGKATWQGCGMHVRCALYGIDEKDRCKNWRKGIYQPCEKEVDKASSTTSSQKK